MLTKEEKYKMCPIFNHIISRPPMIGDFIFTDYCLGVVIDIIDEYDDELDVHRKFFKYYSLYNNDETNYTSFRDYSSHFYFDSDNYVIITKELKDLIVNNISYKQFNKIIEIVLYQDDNNDSPFKYFIYMMLYYIYTYLNSIVDDEIGKMILLSFGIKKVLKKHKNNGLRDVLLGNGQVWQLKRRKVKGTVGKRIAIVNRNLQLNKSDRKKNKTVHYTIIKRLDKHETLIS